MNGKDFRKVSYGTNHDNHHSAGSHGAVQPSGKVLLDGYRESIDSTNANYPRYNPVSEPDTLSLFVLADNVYSLISLIREVLQS